MELILVMTVEPGFGGQSFMPEQLEKVKFFRKKILQAGQKMPHIQVDGGLGENNVELAAKAGANCIVAGTSVFRHPRGAAYAIEKLHQAQAVLPR